MRAHRARWDRGQGWSTPLPVADGPRTLVLVLAGPAVPATDVPVDDLRTAHPASSVLGCSTAGRVLGDLLDEDTAARPPVDVVVEAFGVDHPDVLRQEGRAR